MVTVGAGIGFRLASRHPLLSALIANLFFLIAGGVAALFVDLELHTRPAEAPPFVLVGACLGFGSALLYLYAYIRGYRVPLWIGRSLVVLNLAVLAAGLGAVFAPHPVQVLCASVVGARLLPQSVIGVIQAVRDVRHPQDGEARRARAMTVALRK